MLPGREGQDEALRHDPLLVRADRHEHLWVLGEGKEVRLGHQATRPSSTLRGCVLGWSNAKIATSWASPVMDDRMGSRHRGDLPATIPRIPRLLFTDVCVAW